MTIRQAVIAALGASFLTVASGQALPLPGKYVSADGNFTLNVESANPGNGQMSGSYMTNYGSAGSQEHDGRVGTFTWVNNQQGQSGQAPFIIHFGGSWRPAGWLYAQRDEWNGAYRIDNTILAEGSRAYVASDGSVQVGSLGTQVFKLQN